ncbi:MAG: hypothetical protein KatS3mg082_3359 [Nitrospiraceae bacterium]|nr:MAG: hypothetical protein KatS3mg082_3359 [Nitrospiraceae bacterium]
MTGWCIDISQELVEIIDESWARETLIPPYHIYLKMAYHLSQEARARLDRVPHSPPSSADKLFEFQSAAVRIAARHLNKRGGVILIGDVVGLGKTLMATALARIFEDDYGLETLIICPKNLVSNVGGLPAAVSTRGPRCCRSRGLSRNFPTCAVSAWSLSTKVTTCAIARVSATVPSRSTSLRTTAVSSFCRPRPTTRPISTFPTNSGFSLTRMRTSASGRKDFSRELGRDRIHPPTPMPRPLAGSIREERLR